MLISNSNQIVIEFQFILVTNLIFIAKSL